MDDLLRPAAPPTLFVLSPASATGRRARLLTAQSLRAAGGIPIAELYSFVSALYFRGKITYARHFAAPCPELGDQPIRIIAPGFGLVAPDWPVDRERLRRLARTAVDPRSHTYARPFRRQLAELTAQLSPEVRVVLLGSVASRKYLDILIPVLGPRLHFPTMFAGTGDMQRGALMLRAVREGVELGYSPLSGPTRRPPPLGGL
jgi:hypothetical protein